LQLSPSKPIYAGSRYIIRYSPERMLIADPMPPFSPTPIPRCTVPHAQFFPQKSLTVGSEQWAGLAWLE
jgi:hypothetical protein